MPGLIFLVFAAVAGVGIFAVRAQKQRVALAWSQAARQLGIGLEPGSMLSNPELTGELDSLGVKVDTYTRGSGNNSQTFTRYRVRYPSMGTQFELHRQSGLSAITKFFGSQDIEIGDPRFDDTFVVKSDNPDRVAAVITPTRRTTILQLAGAFPGVRISNTKIQWERRGVDKDPAHIVTVVRRLVGAAHIMSDRAGAGSALDDAIAARNEGDLSQSATKIRDAGRAFGELLEVRRLEAETMAEAGDPEAAALFDSLAKDLPDDDEVKGWQQRLSTPPPQRQVAPKTEAERAPESVDAGAMGDDLFGESKLSFETSRHFDELYKGMVVRWSGKVRSTREYQRDPHLGDTAGTRVVATVARIENDLYGQTTIDAVVGLPPGNANALRGSDEITFQGTLSGIDAMMRNFFVTNARLV